MPEKMLESFKIEDHIARLRGEMASLPEPVKKAFPVGDFLRDIRRSQRLFGFRYISPWQRKFLERLKSYHGPAVPLYHKFSLAFLIKNSLNRLGNLRFPAEIVNFYSDWFERILRDLNSQSNDYYDIVNANFLQDRGICSLAAIPVGGVWIAEISAVSEKAFAKKETASKTKASGLPASKKAISRGLNSLLQKMGLVPLKKQAYLFLKKEKLFYQIHTYGRFIVRSAPEELEKVYLRIAVLLLRNPKIQGIHRCTWLLDPQLESISPHLAHLRQIPEQNGASLFRVGTSTVDRIRALQMSPTRKKLYEEGLYIPVTYAYIWPRERVISWAKKHPVWNSSREFSSF